LTELDFNMYSKVDISRQLFYEARALSKARQNSPSLPLSPPAISPSLSAVLSFLLLSPSKRRADL
jgi:hypothetical protein